MGRRTGKSLQIIRETNLIMKRFIFLLIVVFAMACYYGQPLAAQEDSWKVGVGADIITPQTSMWMAGYGFRDHVAEGTLNDLWVKALAIEDSRGRQAVFVSTDLLGLSKGISDAVTSKLKTLYQLERSQVMLTSSHTHSGPVLYQTLIDIYPLDDDQKKRVVEYSTWLENRIVDVVSEALNNLEPANLYTGIGHTRFAVNRRNNSEQDIATTTNLNGPFDHSVPVLAVERPDGVLRAMVFGYACHATTLNGYQWSGDFPGFAQQELEKSYPGVTALFFAGCGADQNPLPRRTIPLAKQYGEELAGAVSRVLQESMSQVDPFLSTTYGELELAFSALPDKEELLSIKESNIVYHQRWAQRWLQHMESGKAIPANYLHYPVQTWQLGDQTWVALGGEVVVDYSIYLKNLLGQDLFVTAYANDVMAYIPSLRILREGGYEGDTSMRVYGLPAPWSPEVEQKIINEVQRQVNELPSD